MTYQEILDGMRGHKTEWALQALLEKLRDEEQRGKPPTSGGTTPPQQTVLAIG